MNLRIKESKQQRTRVFLGSQQGFDSFSNAGKELIIQYQAKYEKDIECGGGYVKVLG